ncbi:MAG: fibrobacter succinogenes major paralogous domain-containing protein, partial [Saprospiraceae bacterium]
MENSENKSIISTGSSNLFKTEKLLSITQKILSEIKPQYETVMIGTQEWMTRNLDVDRFQNGVLIPHVESNKEWKKAGENGQPAWCYYDNNPENGKKYGKLYNWFAINDPRRLAPKGWHVPTFEEWNSLVEFLGKDDGQVEGQVNRIKNIKRMM